MKQRKNYRGGRHYRLPCRAPCFDHRERLEGWLDPSVKSRLANTLTWIFRSEQLIAGNHILVVTAKFDRHKLVNPEVQGQGNQEGPLYQTNRHTFVFHRGDYCGQKGAKDNRLTKDCVILISAAGSDRHENVVAAGQTCNQTKGRLPVVVFLADQPEKLAEIQSQLTKLVAAAAQSNTIVSQLLKTWPNKAIPSAKPPPIPRPTGRFSAFPKPTALVPRPRRADRSEHLPASAEFIGQGYGKLRRCMPGGHGTPRSKNWPKYCRVRGLGRELPERPSSRKQRHIPFPAGQGIATGYHARIKNKKGQ